MITVEGGGIVSPAWLTQKQAQDYLKVSRTTLYRMVKDGRVVAYSLSGTDDKRYRQDELDTLLTPAPKGQEQDNDR